MKYKLLEPTLTQYYTKHREQVTLKLPEGYVRLTDCDPQMMKYSSAQASIPGPDTWPAQDATEGLTEKTPGEDQLKTRTPTADA